ncbi:MAG TPA: TetR/AcrR family transcriptional regulator [Gaiellales bacterium]|jgi:AcrR family transcriptional regulator
MRRQTSSHPRLTPERRRQQIVRAARASILERGLASTSVREVARAAGVSLGTVTYHFATIDELLTEVLSVTLRDFYRPRRRRMPADATAVDRLRVLIRDHFASPDLYEQCVIWLEYWPRAIHVASARAWRRRRYGAYHRYIARVLAAGGEAGEFTVDDPAELATEFLALFDGLSVALVVEDIDMRFAERSLERFLETRLGVDIAA